MADAFLDGKEQALVRSYFSEYYRHHLRPPSSLQMREFGFGFQKKIDFRHKAFKSEMELKEFILREVPHFISYSGAIYRYPGAQPMGKKEFLGGDLIFDLDADTEHANHSKIYCEYCLQKVRDDTLRLVEEFLMHDFGFPESDISINFSGQKGYHIHLEGSQYRELTQEGRKQLLNYITAADLDIESILVKQKLGYGRFVLRGPAEGSRGWAKKLYNKATEFIRNAKAEDLKYFGLRKSDAENVIQRKEFILKKMAEGNWDLLKGLDKVWENLLRHTISLQSVNIDRSVTFDLARLIRLPDSLHGDTGFIAKTLSYEELKEFEPWKYAVAFKERKVLVRNTDSIEFDFAKQHYHLSSHEELELPESLALLLILKRQVKVV